MIEIKKIAGALGAEIYGVDLSKPLTPDLAQEIRRVFLDNLVIFFHDQKITSEQFMAFAHAMGEPVEYPFVKGIPGYPKIIQVIKLEHELVNFGGVWHSDTTYLDIPPLGSMLLAHELPPTGGDTLFANQYLAYEKLSAGMRRMLDRLIAVNSSAMADVSKTREDRLKTEAREEAQKEYLAEHPAVRTHPETGRKALFVNAAHTLRFKDMTVEESAPILKYLFEHQIKPEFTCRFRWRVGSIAFWDNRCAQHNPINDYHGYRRVMHRITLAGDKPR